MRLPSDLLLIEGHEDFEAYFCDLYVIVDEQRDDLKDAFQQLFTVFLRTIKFSHQGLILT